MFERGFENVTTGRFTAFLAHRQHMTPTTLRKVVVNQIRRLDPSHVVPERKLFARMWQRLTFCTTGSDCWCCLLPLIVEFGAVRDTVFYISAPRWWPSDPELCGWSNGQRISHEGLQWDGSTCPTPHLGSMGSGGWTTIVWWIWLPSKHHLCVYTWGPEVSFDMLIVKVQQALLFTLLQVFATECPVLWYSDNHAPSSRISLVEDEKSLEDHLGCSVSMQN